MTTSKQKWMQALLLNSTLRTTLIVISTILITTPAVANNKTTIHVDVWADNWFAFYLGDELIKEDSVSISTERSFNAESFKFETSLPAQINMVVKDFKENDTGLEYIGTRKQQMGDGGLIAQFVNAENGQTHLVSNEQWRCLAIHIAPLDKSCEKSRQPDTDCKFSSQDEPANWKHADFDDSDWPAATIYQESTVRPKGGYDKVRWHDDAKLIWSGDLETDNTLLCRATLE